MDKTEKAKPADLAPKAEAAKPIKVEAIARGFYGGVLREPGSKFARFVLTDPRQFSRHWMRRVDDEAEIPAMPPARSRPQPSSFTQMVDSNPRPTADVTSDTNVTNREVI